MSAENQQGRLYQRLLFNMDNEPPKSPRPAAGSDRVSEASAVEENQTLAESHEPRALTKATVVSQLPANLMEQIVDRSNLNRAYYKVRSNKGSAGQGTRIAWALFLPLRR